MFHVILFAAVGLLAGISQVGAQLKASESEIDNKLEAIRYGLNGYDDIYNLLDDVEQQGMPSDEGERLESFNNDIYDEVPARANQEVWKPDTIDVDNSETLGDLQASSNTSDTELPTAETELPTQASATVLIATLPPMASTLTTSKEISSKPADTTLVTSANLGTLRTTASIPVIMPTLHPPTPMPGVKEVLKFCEEGQKSTPEKPCKKFRIPYCNEGEKSTTEKPCKPRLKFCHLQQKSTFKKPCKVRWCKFKQISTNKNPCKKIPLWNILKEVKCSGGKRYIKKKARKWVRKMTKHKQERNIHKRLHLWVKKWNLVCKMKKVRHLLKMLKSSKGRNHLTKILNSKMNKLIKQKGREHSKEKMKEKLDMMKNRKGQNRFKKLLGKKEYKIVNQLKNMRKSKSVKNTPSEVEA